MTNDLPFLLMTMLRGSGRGVAYTLKDEFTTPASAPLATPRAAEPIGTLYLETAAQISIANDRLVFTNATSRAAIARSGDLAKQTGRALVVRGGQLTGTTHNIEIGVLNTSNARQFYLSPRSSGGFITTNAAEDYYSYIAGSFLQSLSEASYVLMLTPLGLSAFELKSGTWTHLWHEYIDVGSTFRFGVWPWTLAGGSSQVVVDYFRVADLPSPFNGQWATAYEASPAGSYVGAADQELDIKLTAPAIITTEAGIKYRYRDANNYWHLYFNTSGALKCDVVIAGVVTSVFTVAGVISGGQTIRLRNIMYSDTQRVITGSTSGAWTGRNSVIANSNFMTDTGIVMDVGAGWTAADLLAIARTDARYATFDFL